MNKSLEPREAEEESNEKKPSSLKIWLKYRNKKVRTLIVFLLGALYLSVVCAAAYFCSYRLLVSLWSWGFDGASSGWSKFFAVWGALILLMIPLVIFISFQEWCSEIMNLYAEDAQADFQKKIEEIETQKSSYEEKLEKTDTELLIPLITYSKLELETYYKIGLNQTQKSYRYSITAMWIGFLIIISGAILYLIPANQFFHRPDGAESFQLRILIVISGIIIEMVSALFLWIYKSSMSQLTYFYNRQIYIHNALFAFRIAQTMESSDEAKKKIVEKILDFQLENRRTKIIKRFKKDIE